MIVIKLMGGLGNQMFQHAAASAISRKLKTELLIDLSWFDGLGEDDTKRYYELNNFNLEQKFVNLDDIKFRDRSIANRIFNFNSSRLMPYKEKNFNYDNNFDSIKGSFC